MRTLVAGLGPAPDRESALAASVLWLNVAGAEAAGDVPFRAIPRLWGEARPRLGGEEIPHPIITLAMRSGVEVEECDEEYTWEPHVAAGKALQSVVAAYPDESFPLILAFIGEVGVCEASLNLANFALQFCSFESALQGFLQLISLGLVDERCRVRDVALYCVHALLQGLTSPLEVVGPWLSEVSERVSELVGDLSVGRTAALVIGDFLCISGFPKVSLALASLFGAVCSLRAEVADAASSVLVATMDGLPQPMKAGVLALGIQRLRQTRRPELIAVIQRAVIDVPVGSMLPDIWAALEATGEEARNLVVAFAAVARSAGPRFLERLPVLLEMIVGVAKEPFDGSIAAAAAAVSLLSDAFDLTAVAGDLISGFGPCVSRDLGVRRFVLEALADLVRFAPWLGVDVAAAAQQAAEVLPEILQSLDDDDGDAEPLEIACVRCALAAFACAPEAADSLSAVLAVMGALKEIDDSVLSICMDAIVVLGSSHPSAVVGSPSVEAIVRAAMAGDVSPEVTRRACEALGIVLEVDGD